MGNNLVAIAPSQTEIKKVEQCIQDLQTDRHIQIGIHIENEKIRFQGNLGSTRFFKVAKCNSGYGPLVVKVFVINEPNNKEITNHIKECLRRIQDLKDILSPTFNCLPFSSILTERAGFIIRQYGKYSLYDRISTRPFLSNLEKRWLTFQLLWAVDQCHSLNVCHGDIKLENIMVSSWSWLTLTDFASFKPTILPEDNPSDYNYFFDTSRRGTCYIAPERFLPQGKISGEDQNLGNGLKPTMDIFSVGCCIAELFTDGQTLFERSQLLAYRDGDTSHRDQVLKKIKDEDIRDLVTKMIAVDSSSRLLAKEYLDQERGKVFPQNFYTFLQQYILMFSRHSPLMSSDEKIQRIYKACFEKEENKDLPYFESLLQSSDPDKKIDSGCLVIVTNVVTSCIRSLQLVSSKLSCLSVLEWLSARVSSEIICERILPQLIFYLSKNPKNQNVPAVMTRAISVLVTSTGHVKHVSMSDAKTWPEYILPALSELSQHPEIKVRCALARNLAQLAQLATDWLDMVIISQTGQPVTDYHNELSNLHESVVKIAKPLIEARENSVKQVLVTESATKLAVWLGRQRAYDVLLKHMVTFLNDNDRQLRYCFFDNIAGVASFVGWHCIDNLKALLGEGLFDQEEMVVCRTINAISDLVSQGLLEKVSIFEMMRMIIPFLLHPNLWIRHASAGFVEAVSGKLDNVDIQVKLSSMLTPVLKQSLIQVNVPQLLLSHCAEPVPRAVLDQVTSYSDISSLLYVLEERENARKLAKQTGGSASQQPLYPEMTPQLKQLFARLADAGMLPAVECKVLALKDYIVKVSKSRGQENVKKLNGRIEFGNSEVVKLDDEEPRRSDSGEIEMWHQNETEESGNDSKPLEAPCQAELRNVIKEMKAELNSVYDRKERVDKMERNAAVGDWKPRGVLVAHLAEHQGGVTKLAAIPDTTLVASASIDGTLRIWDCAKMESGKNLANRARQVYHRHIAIDCVAASSHNNYLATAARDGAVTVFNWEKQEMVSSRSVNLEEEGDLVELIFCDLNTSPLLFYATSKGSIIGWDLRKQGNAMSFKQDLRQGNTTAMCVAGHETWLAAGTCNGVVTVWDLRFGIQVGSLMHPNKARVRRLGSVGPGKLAMAVEGNNELGIWDVESSSRQKKVVSNSSGSQHSVTCFNVLSKDRFITGGTDCKLRFWQLHHPQEVITLGHHGDAGNVTGVTSKLVEGCQEFTEVGGAGGGRGEGDGGGGGGRIQADIQHTDLVTDMTLCQTQQTLLVTASNDGVIKLWK